MTAPQLPHLFAPFPLGDLLLKNRIVMAPMTRGRAAPDGTPTAMIAEHYRSRATAGALITEATAISATAGGWPGAPGLWTDAHVAGWRRVTDAVHEAGGTIFVQLWHMGRVSHPDLLGGATPVGASPIAARGDVHTPRGKRAYVVPRELATGEIAAIVADYAAATARARDAGFDGVELHAANGYLIDQFLRDGTNRRTDAYGGSPGNRARFLLEVTTACARAWSPGHVGVRLSPTGTFNDMGDGDPAATFGHAAAELDRLGLLWLHVVEPLQGSPMHVPAPPLLGLLRERFRGPLIANGGYDGAVANATISARRADLVSFGMAFLANPDLVRRLQYGAALNRPDFATLYTPGPKGYNDYPTLG